MIPIMCVPNRECFSCSEKLDGCSIVMGDDRPCNMEGIGIIFIKMFDRMMRELKGSEVCTSIEENLISVSAFKEFGLEISDKDGVLKMLRGPMVVMKDV